MSNITATGSPGGQILGPVPGVSHLVGLEYGLGISKKIPKNTDVAGMWGHRWRTTAMTLIIDQRDTGLQLRDLVSREGREFVDILPSFYC